MKVDDILRQAMSSANRYQFAQNVVKFLNDNDLDGVDFDWEYPSVSFSLRRAAFGKDIDQY